MQQPPIDAREAVERVNPSFRGWYADSAEGWAAPYALENQPGKVIQLVDRIRARLADRPRRSPKT